MRKCLLLALALVMLLASVTAYAGEAPRTTKNGHVFYDPPITVNLARAVGPEVKFKPGQDINNNEYHDWILEEFGVKVNYIWTTPTSDDAFYTKLMLSLSAGEELPEFFTITKDHAHELIDAGLVQPIDEMYEQYAGPVWKAAYDEVPQIWLPYVRDGKTYAFPRADYTYEHEDVMWMRQDWLDAVGMKAPTTLDELKAVMDAFIALSPDVTKQEKVYGFAATMMYNYKAWIGANPIWGGFGIVPQIWDKDENGDIVYTSTQEKCKEVLAEFRSWVEKGYFAPDVCLMQEMDAAALFTSGRAGIAMGPTWLYSWPLRDAEKNIEGAKVVAYPLPTGNDGTLVQHGEAEHYQVVLFSKTAKNPQVFFEITDYLYENTTDPELDSPWAWGFKEGFDYVMKDGLPSFEDEDIPDKQASIHPFMGPIIPSQKVAIASFLAEGNEPVRPSQITKSIIWKTDTNFIKAAQYVLAQRDTVHYDMRTGAPSELYVEKWADLARVENETFANIISGKVGVDEGFASWLKFWNENGGPEITKEIRDWYAAVGGK